MVDRRAHRLDALALNQNLAGLENVSGIDLEQPRRMQHDGRSGGCWAGEPTPATTKHDRSESGSQSKLRKESPHEYDYAVPGPGLSTKNFSWTGSRVAPQYAPIPVRFCPRISV
jgi:hypothetical protein